MLGFNLVQNVVRFWMSKNIDGILLSEAGLYVDDDCPSNAPWLEAVHHCKIFTNKTVEVIQKLREVMDDFSQKTGKEKWD